MASNSDIATIHLKMKLELEGPFKKSLTRLFKSMYAFYKKEIKLTGQPPDANSFKSDFENLIFKQYSKVAKSFAKIDSDKSKKEDEDEEDISEELIAVMLLLAEAEASRQAQEITRTNNKQFLESFNIAQNEIIQSGEATTNIALALLATAALKSRAGGRDGNIAISETQWASETTKFTEHELSTVGTSTLLIILNGGLTPYFTSNIDKEWWSILDGRERAAHGRANGQKVKANDYFIVWGERLLYPSDRSAGATLKNILRCRCTATYS